MSPFASPRLVSYVGLAALGLIAALALRRAELVVVAAPFALVVAAGLLLEGRPKVVAWLSVDRDLALEGDEISAVVEVHAGTAIDLLELHLLIPRGLRVVEGNDPCGIRLGAGEDPGDDLIRTPHASRGPLGASSAMAQRVVWT